jgi:2-polyprenyl-3-methyl-5-hydroxy-6-metoxy-1,4-benzoquinol methylase
MLTKALKTTVRRVLPLATRKRLAVWLHNCAWMPRERRMWWSQQLVRDFAEVDVNAYHKFLWANHMAYAKTYDTETRFGEDNLNATRRMFLDELVQILKDRNIEPSRNVDSVFDVGCSLGYLLRHVESNLFPAASRLAGIDIDARAIHDGREHLDRLQSKVDIARADMEDLADILADDRYDVFFCTGVLMYLEEQSAAAVVKNILDHTGIVAGFTGLAHPTTDNADLEQSGVRDEDGTFIHNIDGMVTAAGGHVIQRRWEGDRLADGNSIYFVFAAR